MIFTKTQRLGERLKRILDRGKNWYKETVTDLKIEKLLHFQNHPLDQHRGHGSDKLNKKVTFE
jgi:hypothetical protein